MKHVSDLNLIDKNNKTKQKLVLFHGGYETCFIFKKNEEVK